jgi:bifunctional ADP-heptose synthase (sugar kinase/adenylyltransferase)
VIELAKRKNIITAVDPKNRNFCFYRQVDLFKPNLKEFKDGLKLKVDTTDMEELKKIAMKFKKENQIGLLFITLSELGVLMSNEEAQNLYPSKVYDIADVSGAGDTVIATASLCLAAGMPIQVISQLSNLAGGLVCEKPGVVPINIEQLKKEAKKIQMI